MAEIYRARYRGEQGFTKIVAVKRIRPEWVRDPYFVQLFLDEARALVSLQHTNVVQVLELGRWEGELFLSMEFVDGIDLRTLLRFRQQGRLALERRHLFAMVGQVLEGLDYVHRARDAQGEALGIIHRDLSPSNILVSWHGEVKIADFGLAALR